MSEVIRIALVGDFDASITAHRAIPAALAISSKRLDVEVIPQWIPTIEIDATNSRLAGFAAIWCVPGSPYASMAGALAAIRFARESHRPFLGTCGGFQHAILDYVRHVLGKSAADHAESSSDAAMPVIARLTCSLVEKSGRVDLLEGTMLRAICGPALEEEYHCNYGMNPEYDALLGGATGLRIAGRDAGGEVRAVELAGHPFFIGTLFQPERSCLRGIEHPLIAAFIEAARRSQSVANS